HNRSRVQPCPELGHRASQTKPPRCFLLRSERRWRTKRLGLRSNALVLGLGQLVNRSDGPRANSSSSISRKPVGPTLYCSNNLAGAPGAGPLPLTWNSTSTPAVVRWMVNVPSPTMQFCQVPLPELQSSPSCPL